MKTGLATTLVCAALISPMAAQAADDKGPVDRVKEHVGDTVITAKIKAEMAEDKVVAARNISVNTDAKGVVTLTGNAKTYAEAERAVTIARNTKGVVSVQNNIRVDAR